MRQMSKQLMKQMVNRVRLVLAIEGTPVAVRIVPHKSDASKLVLKALHPEVAGMLCQVMGVVPGKTWQGSNYFLTEVDAEAFQKSVPVFVAQAMAAARELDAERLAAKGEAKAIGSSKCENCGCDDGTHWGFCQATKMLAN